MPLNIDWLQGFIPDGRGAGTEYKELVTDMGGVPRAGKGTTRASVAGTVHRVAYGTVFYGVRTDGAGYLVATSGAAHQIAPWATLHGLRATRMDIALTNDTEMSAEYLVLELDELHRASSSEDWLHVKPKRVLYDGDGGKTLYVGTRTSGRMLRCYSKELSAGAAPALRAEWELRHHIASAVFSRYAAGGNDALWRVWLEETSALPPAMQAILLTLAGARHQHAGARPVYRRGGNDVETGLAYLDNTITPLLHKLAAAGAAADVQSWYNRSMMQGVVHYGRGRDAGIGHPQTDTVFGRVAGGVAMDIQADD